MAIATLAERGELSRAARSFLRTEAGSAVLLLGAAVLALLWTNLLGGYEEFWHTELTLTLGGREFGLDLRHWVNDGLMVLFFLSVGLEIARETTLGELRGVRALVAPSLGALGGLAVPAALYLLFNAGGAGAAAWGVPISTDTAALLGVLALVGPRCPDQLRVFLLALAIVDDIGAVLAIALFYTDEVDVVALLLAVGLFAALLGLRFVHFWRTPVYVAIGVAMWLAVLRSGVHPSVVGVAMGLLVNAYAPRRYDIARVQVTGRSFLVDPTPDRAAAAQAAVTEAVSPNERLQLRIQPWSSYVIVPLFVLANAGVLLTAETLRAAGDVADHVGHRGRARGGQADRRDRGHVAGAEDTPGCSAGHPALGPAGRRRGPVGDRVHRGAVRHRAGPGRPGARRRGQDRDPGRVDPGRRRRLVDLPAGGGARRPVRAERAAGAAATTVATGGVAPLLGVDARSFVSARVTGDDAAQARLPSGSAGRRAGSSAARVRARPGPVLRVSNRTVTRPCPAPCTQPCPCSA